MLPKDEIIRLLDYAERHKCTKIYLRDAILTKRNASELPAPGTKNIRNVIKN
ncbi:perakine reductase-like [Dorcoceras hygrometricum]|uniref:Perakine reductase-like n=1 Tax=Dorcoceras hygrometricum TaxID=472368 RepID=A0A2Z7BC84_9LAMI|nr:perakine reductase-like [Dorcoceras hygrometricum]